MRYQSIVCRTTFTSLLAAAALAWLSPAHSPPGAFAQERDRGERDRGSRRFDPKESIPRMDANGNGTLEPSEISDRSRYYLEQAAKDAGLDLARGVSVQKMIEAMEKRNAAREAAASSAPGSPPSGGASPPGSSGRSSGGSRSDRGFPGFGAPDPSPKPPGFDVPPSSPTKSSGVKYDRRVVEYVDKMFADYDLNKDGVLDKGEIEKAPWQSDPKESDLNKDGKLDREELNQRIAKRFGLLPTSAAPSAGGSTSSGSSASSGESQRVRAYAEGLLRQYDANKNGVLDKDEWSNVRAISKDTDANNDGTVTLDELAIKLGAYGKDDGKASGGATASSGGAPASGGGSSGSRSSSGSSRSDSRTSGSGEKKSYRQRAPTERLPKGLPDWFARNDEDGDGQVVMSEYTTLWSDSKATEFAKFDLDGDGVITPRECLRALEMETKKK